jgi:NADPH:quinone reductase-like Zn-dependent oxidoreductase
MDNTTLEVDRTSHGTTRLVDDEVTAGDDQVLFRIDRFALTANNVTYAVAGDMLGYWDFFPTEGGWGRVPAMGWADVVESNVDGVEVGGRYYGWFPMARHAAMTATPTSDGLRDDGAHRQAHAAVHRGYTRTDRDNWYQEGDDAEDRHALLRGLFLTGFLAEEFFADDGYFGAEQVLVLSASSKTAIGFAQRAAERAACSVVGLTSAGNADFVRSLGYYDQVVTYDDLSNVHSAPSVIIDMAGNSSLVAQLHDALGDGIGYSMQVGMSHHDAPPAAVTSGPTPTLFFAPSEVARRAEQWGAAGYAERTTNALFDFVEGSHSWMSIETARGAAAGQQTWSRVYSGDVAPSIGCIVSMHDAS